MKDKITLMAACFAVMLAWVIIITAIFNLGNMSHLMNGIVFSCILAPLMEELVFRKGALDLVKDKPDLQLPVAILSSALFGYLHGGTNNIFLQGAFGMIFSYVYLRIGYWGSVILHSLWNLVVIFLIQFK